MSRYTKLAGWVLTFFLIGRVGAFIGDISLVKEYGPEVPAGIGKLWDGVRLILFKFSNVGAAIWLFLDEGKRRSPRLRRRLLSLPGSCSWTDPLHQPALFPRPDHGVPYRHQSCP
ncbi:hypothetical protein N8580_03850 [Akkermansiaceae bacterium]|nr:hypothetical protein [Akkermansiaceae bacterium]